MKTYSNEERLAFAKSRNCEEVKLLELDNGNFIATNTTVWDNVTIGFNNVIGRSGFGYAREENGKLVHIPHNGSVCIQNDDPVRSETTAS